MLLKIIFREICKNSSVHTIFKECKFFLAILINLHPTSRKIGIDANQIVMDTALA